MALTPSFWSWRINDYYKEISNSTQSNDTSSSNPEGMILADLATCIFLSIMTAILGMTSVTVLRLIFRRRASEPVGPMLRHRISVYAVGSIFLFLLLASGTIVYSTNAFLSVKEVLCMLRNTETTSSTIPSDLARSQYIGGCRAALDQSVGGAQYVDKAEYLLHFMFARIFQVAFLVADGLLVYRCYVIFAAKGDHIYISAVAIYAVTLSVSVMEMCGIFAYNEKPIEGVRDLWALVPVATTLNDLRYMWLTFSLITNVLSTSLIIYRIVQVHRQSHHDADSGYLHRERNDTSRWQSLYSKVIAILIEAMLPPALCGIATIITWYTGTASSADSSGWSYHRVLALRMFLTLWLGTSVLAPQLIAIYTLKRRLLSMNEAEDRNHGKDIWHVEPLVFRHTAYTHTRTHAITQYDSPPPEGVGLKEAIESQDITEGGRIC